MRFSKHGFTLIEMLFVASIIAILTLVIFNTVSGMRAKARDAQRVTDIQTLQLALKLYRESYGTYQVSQPAATGLNNTGTGWISYTGTNYTKSIAQGLYDQRLIPRNQILDPSLGAQGYALFLCDGGKEYGLFARKERPTSEDTAALRGICGAGTATATPYSMNYGVGG